MTEWPSRTVICINMDTGQMTPYRCNTIDEFFELNEKIEKSSNLMVINITIDEAI
ncbi:MAG: hypothetical protein PHG93_06100 [Candidatus Methanomethylophilaceae archaeon]|nr:hypothetical protein [Candidatus Methanomethylophilaceae archaeon]